MEPFEDGILVEADLTKTHRLIFNKYPVRNKHVLIITKQMEQQTDLINSRDFEATALVMKALDGFAFYNGSESAGSS